MKAVLNDMPLPEESFHRVLVDATDSLYVTPTDKPVAVWIPSGYRVRISTDKGTVLDLSEVVDHEDMVTMDRKLREKDRTMRRVKRQLKQARRKMRGLDRVSI